MPSATGGRRSTPPPRRSSPPASMRRSVRSRPGRVSGWARSTATSPTRADLVTAVYRHQIEACAEAGPNLPASADSPLKALRQWIDRFVDFLVTRHGLADALRSDDDRFAALHAHFLDRLLPVCAHLLDAAVEAGDIKTGTQPYELVRGIGNLCIGRADDPRYEPRRLIALLLQGLQRPRAS